jgi:hypothetical protein
MSIDMVPPLPSVSHTLGKRTITPHQFNAHILVAHPFRTFRVTELALYHSLGKLPEPELTHRFF